MHYNRGRDFRPVPCEKTYGNTSWGDLLTRYNGTAITYDTIGNPLNWRNAMDIEWYGRQMSLFANNDGSIADYSYNADGIRVSKTLYDTEANLIGNISYTLDGNRIIAENRLGTKIYYTYDDKGAIMGMYYGGENYIFSKNLQGDVIGIYNENRQLVAKYSYNAYGQILSITNASGNDVSGNATHIANVNPFRYRGYYYDTETGFYYLQSRYYDPVVGRFLNADVYAEPSREYSVLDYASNVGSNLLAAKVSSAFDVKMPNCISDIKDDAIDLGIKGTNRLNTYLDYRRTEALWTTSQMDFLFGVNLMSIESAIFDD